MEEEALLFGHLFWNKHSLPSFQLAQSLFEACVTNSSPNEIMKYVISSLLFYTEFRDKDRSHQSSGRQMGLAGWTKTSKDIHTSNCCFTSYRARHLTILHHTVSLDSPLCSSHVTACQPDLVYQVPIAQYPLTVSRPWMKETHNLCKKLCVLHVFYANGINTLIASYTCPMVVTSWGACQETME